MVKALGQGRWGEGPTRPGRAEPTEVGSREVAGQALAHQRVCPPGPSRRTECQGGTVSFLFAPKTPELKRADLGVLLASWLYVGPGPRPEDPHCLLGEETSQSGPAAPPFPVHTGATAHTDTGTQREHTRAAYSGEATGWPPGDTCSVSGGRGVTEGRPLSAAITCREKEREVAEVEVGAVGGPPGRSCQAGS